MRIAHVTATFPPYYGGTGNVCYHNARVLAARGHDVHVFTAEWPGERDDPPGVTVHRLRPLLRVGNVPVLPQLLRLGRFDIIHLHYPFYTGAEFIALGRTPYVVTYHQDVQIDGLIGMGTRLHGRTVGLTVLRRASRVCPTSLDYFQRSVYKDLLLESPESVVEIPNGVDVERFRPGPIDLETRRELAVPGSAFVVLFVGAMDRPHFFKGIPTLLRSLGRVPLAHAVLVGDGDLRHVFEQQAQDLGLANRVSFKGRVKMEKLAAAYRCADVLALPSETCGEAFGMVLLEAMASGRPVIASNLPGVRSVVTDGVDGFLIPPGDVEELTMTIQRVATMSVDQRAAVGQAGRRKVESTYGWERIGDRLESLYVEVTGSRLMRYAS